MVFRGHFEPQQSQSLPSSAVLSLAVNESAWFESNFYIYSCDAWLGGDDHDFSNQPLIWATGSHGQGYGTSLSMHDDKGFFSLDLGSQPTQNTTTEPVHPPTTDAGKEHSSNSRRTVAFYLHGFSLVFGIMILYPAGAALLRFSDLQPFRVHLFFQISASVLCLAGAAAAAYAVTDEPHVSGENKRGAWREAFLLLLMLHIATDLFS